MEEMKIEEPLKSPKGFGTRHTLMILGFIGFAASYALRFNLSLAIVAMVKHKHGKTFSDQNTNGSLFSTIQEDACPNLKSPNVSTTGVAVEEGEFEWDEAEQGIILGSFFWGYIITQLPGGILSAKFGGKHPLGFGLLLTAIFALLTPAAARTHKFALIFVRFVQGLGEGLTTPAMHNIIGQWAVPSERSIMGSVIYAGCQFGTALTMIISGYLIHFNVLNDGWGSVFWSTGIFTIIWFIFWCFFVYNSPAEHPRITTEERNYIQKSIGNLPSTSNNKLKTPWVEIFTSLPFWAIVIGHTGHAYGLYTLLTELPTYLKTILHFDIKQNSWLSAIPYLLMWIISIIVTQIIDYLISRKIVKTVSARKVCQAISQIGPAILLLAASVSGCERELTVILLTLAVGVNGVVYGGYVVNHVDLSSNHSGILMGITNTFANLTGFIAPSVAGALIKNNATLGRWQIVFGISAAIYCLGALFFISFAQATEQSWNKEKPEKNHEKETAKSSTDK